ncbi:MAG: hypothetical protein WHX53_15020, partial [Anaerolineae bacterium]
MNILVIGSGGREHALAWKLAQSPRVKRVFVAPGNGGTDGEQGIENCEWRMANGEWRITDQAGWSSLVIRHSSFAIHDSSFAIHDSSFAIRHSPFALVVVGPEAPLAEGIADTLAAAGVRCFGPTRAAARLEWSKAFAKEFMIRHGIPTGRAAIFTSYEPALAYLRRSDRPVVIKASGLAAGKGVIVPQTPAEAEDALRQIMVERQFGAAGDEVLIEERLTGPEVSLLAFCDGRTVVPMPPAQD